MVKQRVTLAIAAIFVLLFSLSASAQSARIEGIVARSSKQKSSFTVRARSSTSYDEKVVFYDSSTQFTAQAHGDKTGKDIDASQIKDGDRVICLGAYNEKKEFVAAFISKRLSQ